MAKKINTALYKSTGGGFDMSKLPTANILREVEVTAKKPVQKEAASKPQIISNPPQSKDTLFVDNANDPRLKAYRDSMQLNSYSNDLLRKAQSLENNKTVDAPLSMVRYQSEKSLPKSNIKPVSNIPYSARDKDSKNGFLPFTVGSSENTMGNIPIYQRPVRPVAVRDQTSLVNLQQMDEFEVVANRINRPQAGIEKPQSNALINGYRLAPEGGIRNRDIVEAFKPEFDAELALDNDSTTAFNNMLEKRNINAPRTRSIGRYRENYRNNYNPEFIRRILINQSNNYKPL